ncbi:MAG: TetR/AcrR family transcriptional regulator [Myxococcales bacterium]|nr:MAG: TetR/AcrR family transcriptional regulator [Myxococcales bacterium]
MRSLNKETILEKAAEVVLSSGYTNARLEDIAKKIGVSRPNLYYYFENKNALMLSLMDWVEEEYREKIFEPLAKSQDPMIAIPRVIDYFIDTLKQAHSGSSCILGTLASGVDSQNEIFRKRIGSILDNFVEQVRRHFAMTLERGSSSGELSSDQLARVFVATLQGSLMVYKINKSLEYLLDYRAIVVKFLESIIEERRTAHLV